MLHWLRAQTHGALGKHASACADMSDLVERYMKVDDAARALFLPTVQR